MEIEFLGSIRLSEKWVAIILEVIKVLDSCLVNQYAIWERCFDVQFFLRNTDWNGENPDSISSKKIVG